MMMDWVCLKNKKIRKKGRLRTQKRKNKKNFSIRTSDSPAQAGQPKTSNSAIAPDPVDEIEEKKRQARTLRFGIPNKSFGNTHPTSPTFLPSEVNGSKVNSSSSINRSTQDIF